MKPTLIRFDPVMRARLDALCESNGMSLGNLIRTIVAEWFIWKDAANRSTIDPNPKA